MLLPSAVREPDSSLLVCLSLLFLTSVFYLLPKLTLIWTFLNYFVSYMSLLCTSSGACEGQKQMAASFLLQPESTVRSFNVFACVAHTALKACHHCYTLDHWWIKCCILVINTVIYSSWHLQGNENSHICCISLVHCKQSNQSDTKLSLAHTKMSQCAACTYYRKQLFKRAHKNLIITRLYMPIRLSILERIFIWHHICVLTADERNWILNLLVPLEGKQSKRVY